MKARVNWNYEQAKMQHQSCYSTGRWWCFSLVRRKIMNLVHKVYRNTVISILQGKAGVWGCSFIRGNWLLKRSQDDMQHFFGNSCLAVFDGQVKVSSWTKEIQKSLSCPTKLFFLFESLSISPKIQQTSWLSLEYVQNQYLRMLSDFTEHQENQRK